MILYHGTTNRFDKFRPFSFFAEEFTVAHEYATYRGVYHNTPGRVIQCSVDVGKVMEVPASVVADIAGWTYEVDSNPEYGGSFGGGDFTFGVSDRMLRAMLHAADADTLILTGMKDINPPGYRGCYKQYMIRDPSRVRMVNESIIYADPAKSSWEPGGYIAHDAQEYHNAA